MVTMSILLHRDSDVATLDSVENVKSQHRGVCSQVYVVWEKPSEPFFIQPCQGGAEVRAERPR